MAQKYPAQPARSSRNLPPKPGKQLHARPGQDIIVRKQAAKFPAVGVTLNSYKQNSTNGHFSLDLPAAEAAKHGQPGRFKRFLKKITLKRSLIIFGILILLIGGWLGFKLFYNANRIFGGNILGVLHTTKLKGEDTGRVNILLAGNSADDVGHNGGQLTDSIMIASIDTKNHTAYLMSIPRDLWVDVDGDYQKINAAYVTGEANDFDEPGYAKGGMGQLEKVIHDNLGITLNYYALVNYNALREAVNAVGGVDFKVESDDPRGLYDPNIDYVTHGPLVKLSNGTHHLNGQQALNLSRARGDSYYSYGFAQSDFTRTENQRKLLMALKTKAVSAGVLSNPAKVTALFDAVGGNVKTDFTLSEVRRAYDLTKDISGNKVKSLSLNDANGKNLLASYTAPGGQSALIPAAGVDDYSEIRAFINQQTSSNPVVREGAKIVLLNATDTTGLASKQRTALTAKNINVVAIADAQATQASTTIIDVSGGKKSATKAYLLKTYGNHFTTTNPYSNYDADFIILLGADQIKTTDTTSSQ